MSLAFIALWLAAAPTVGAPAADPLAPAWQGQVQCYGPDPARRTCLSIGSYARRADGGLDATAVVLMASKPQIVMRTVSPVALKGGAVCGVIAARDLDTATFTLDGKSADAEEAEAIRKAIAPSYAPMLNREICSTFSPEGAGMKAQVTVDGRRRPDLDLPVRWISPDEGFEVRP